MARVVVEDLSLSYPGSRGREIRALDRLSLAVESNELLVVVGPSGSGKTTLLRAIAGLEKPDAGSIRINKQVVTHLAPAARNVAMVFQSPALYPEMTARENMAFGLRIRHVDRDETFRRVNDTAALLGISACLDRRPMHLSGGERQRVALGRALVRNPDVLLLDEPLSALDGPARARLRSELAQIQKSLGVTMIYVTHDQVDAMTLAHLLVVLHEGKAQQIGPPAHIYRHPTNVFVAAFLGSPPINLVRGSIARAGSGLAFHTPGETPLNLPVSTNHEKALQAVIGREITLGIRPEHIHLVHSVADSQSGSILTGMVLSVENLGAESVARIQVGPVQLALRVPGDVEDNAPLRVQLLMSRASYFDSLTGQALV